MPHVPEALDALIAACLEKDRARRPPSADAVIEALDRLASRLAWTQRDATAWWEEFDRRNDDSVTAAAPSRAGADARAKKRGRLAAPASHFKR